MTNTDMDSLNLGFTQGHLVSLSVMIGLDKILWGAKVFINIMMQVSWHFAFSSAQMLQVR